MPGPSFCWGPELEGPRSPSPSRSSTWGRADRDRRRVRRSRAPAPPARVTCTTPTTRTDPAPSRSLAPPTRRLARVACTSPPLAPRVRRSSTLPFYLDQGRGRRAEAARRRRGGPCGLGARLGAQGVAWGGRGGAPRPPPRRRALGPKRPSDRNKFIFQALRCVFVFVGLLSGFARSF